MEVPIGNRHLNKNIFETFGLDPCEGQTFYDSGSDSTGFEEAEQVDLDGDAVSPDSPTEPDVGALRRQHTVIVNYPSLNLLTDSAEEFIMNKPKSPEQRYAPHPLVRDDAVMRHAARDRITDNGFYSLYRCDHPFEPSDRDFSTHNIFIDVEEATKLHGKTDLSVVIFKHKLQPELGPQIRIRRSTRFIWCDLADYNEWDYTFALRDFVLTEQFGSTDVKPTWYEDLIHLIGVESDRAARFIALKLEHYAAAGTPRKDLGDIHIKFIKSFGAEPRWIEDFDNHLSQIIKPHKTPAYKIAPKCVSCQLKCERYVSLPCSKDHAIHGSCLMEICRSTDTTKVACLICRSPVFTDKIDIRALKFNVHEDNLFYNDDRYSEWENFEKSCSDLDIKTAALNDLRITITRDFMTGLWRKLVTSSIEPNIPEHLRFNIPEEYFLLEAMIEGQFMHLEGVRTTISSIDRWVKRRVFIKFRADFMKWQLQLALPHADRPLLHHHDLMRKVLRRGWYDQYLKNLNRTLQFLSERACLCQDGEDKIYHWHGHREYYNPRAVEREQAVVTEKRKRVYEWQEGEGGRQMMKLFLNEVRKGGEEAARRERKGKSGPGSRG